MSARSARLAAGARDREQSDLNWQGQIEATDAGRESLREATEPW